MKKTTRKKTTATPVPRRAAGRAMRSAESPPASPASTANGASSSKRRRTESGSPSPLLKAMPKNKPLSDTIIVRPMHLRDCAACFHLGNKVFTSQFPNLYRLWDEYEVVGAFTGCQDKCFVAETADHELVGFVFGDVIKKRRTTSYGYIHWIAVDPLYQRRGIGTMLYNRVLPVMTEHDNARLILCDTPADNTSARTFFAHHHFGKPIEHVYMSRNVRELGIGGPPPKRNSGVEIREMTIDDIYPVYLLGERVFGNQSAPNLFRFWEASEVLDLFETDSEFCLVAEVDDELVGFCLGTTIKKKRSAWKYGYLIWLGVSPDCQGKGIGGLLARHFQEIAIQDGASMIFIDTQADSDAVKFWQRMGFGHAQDHVFLSKTVTDNEREALQEKMAATHQLISIAPTKKRREPINNDSGMNGSGIVTSSSGGSLHQMEKTAPSPWFRRGRRASVVEVEAVEEAEGQEGQQGAAGSASASRDGHDDGGESDEQKKERKEVEVRAKAAMSATARPKRRR